MPWQPFTTAPKTPRVGDQGPRFLAYGERGSTICYWQYNDGFLDSAVQGWWVDPTVIPSVPKNFTHWMPVPDGPDSDEPASP